MSCEHHIRNTLSLQFCKDHLAPCRFKCWTNQISIGISQPLAQLQRRYNVEIPRVSLHVVRLKWDFRTDRYSINKISIYHIYQWYIPNIYQVYDIIEVKGFMWTCICDIPSINLIYISINSIYQVYTWYIPCIYLSYDDIQYIPDIHLLKTFCDILVPVT